MCSSRATAWWRSSNCLESTRATLAKDNSLRISGKKIISYRDGASLHRRERLSGTFDRTLTVPMQIDANAIRAEYRDGVLALFTPRAESDKPRSIAIT
jgi:HSP20 family protein